MNLGSSLTRIRRIVRDDNKGVFSDAQLKRVWNEIQLKFAADTDLLEEEVNLPVPSLIQMTYTQRWEDEFSSYPSNLLYSFMDNYTYSQPWEPVSIRPIIPAVDGGVTSTQSWEAFYADVQHRLPHFFPSDYITYSYVGLDNKPIESQDRRKLESKNESFLTKTGDYPVLYVNDYVSGVFYLYPKKVDVYGAKDLSSDFGVVVYDEDDNINPDSDYGVIVYSSDSHIDEDYGCVSSFQIAEDNITLIYTKAPRHVSEDNDVSDLPSWSLKYVEFGVLEKLFRMETDLQLLTLSEHFKDRYEAGLFLVSQYKSKAKTMRAYKLEQQSHRTHFRKRLADLPSSYPSYWR